MHCSVDGLWISLTGLWITFTLPVKPKSSPTRHLGMLLACAPPNSHTTSMGIRHIPTLASWLSADLARILLMQESCQLDRSPNNHDAIVGMRRHDHVAVMGIVRSYRDHDANVVMRRQDHDGDVVIVRSYRVASCIIDPPI